jgi:eukaryotic-like serine/threonine-protein kinase
MVRGKRIAGRFELECEVGAGGMGTVYRALDLDAGGVVAIKMLRARDREGIERFEREAQILAELDHPRIVRYVDHGEAEPGQRYLAMEWLAGEDLDRRLAGGRLSISESITLARHVAEALAVAHGRGIVHRDIKPSNLLLCDGDLARVKLLDFGIARVRRPVQHLTQTGAAIGTPRYMAPEQARGEREVDARADVFSLGCVLFECLSGRPAFAGESPIAVLAKILLEDAPRVGSLCPGVPEAVECLVVRMLSKSPSHRPADAAVVVAALAALSSPDSVQTTGLSSHPTALTAAERRTVSVLLVGASKAPLNEGLVETLDPSGATSTNVVEPSLLIGLLRAVAAPFGGEVEPLLDGSVVVTVPGCGVATDQAARAAACGLAFRGVVPEAPMVLATGAIDRGGQLPVGEVIDRAVRMLSDDPPPAFAIRIDDVTAGLLDPGFEVAGDAAGLFLRGRREQEGVRTLLGRATPYVGRETELAMLDAMVVQCASEPVARAVLVTGPPGIGKSRLRYELVRKVRNGGLGVQVWVTRGDPMISRSTFGMAAQAVRKTAGLLDREPVEVQRQKLRARVARNVDPREVERVTELLGEVAGVPFPDDGRVYLRAARRDPAAMQNQVRRAWEDFVAAECEAGPLLLVLEDLHWGDEATVALVGAALRRCAERPLMVLALARPEVGDTFPGLWADHDVRALQLFGLTRKAAERLAQAVLGEKAHDATVTRLAEQAGGNAFYLEELIRAVAEGHGAALPETVLAMVEARLGELPAEARRVLRAASVFGVVFRADGLDALLGGANGGAETRRWLDDLVHREVLTRRGELAVAEDAEHVFRHALLREAAYAMLMEEDRVLAHRLAADWLESEGGSDPVVIAEVAAHAERVGEALLRSGDADGAATAFARVASCRGRINQLEPVIVALLRALELADATRRSPADLAGWLTTLSKAISRVRAAPDHSSSTARALERISEAGTIEQAVGANVDMARAIGAMNRFDEAYRLLARAAAAADEQAALLRTVLVVEMEIAGRQGDFRRAVGAADQLEAIGLADEPWVLRQYAYARSAVGAYDAALAALDRADSLDGPEDPFAISDRLKARFLVLCSSTHFDAALPLAARAVAAARAAGLGFDTAVALHNQGDLQLRAGDLRAARASLLESQEVARSNGNEGLVARDEAYLVYLDGLEGASGAVTALEKLIREADRRGSYVDGVECRRLQAMLIRHGGERDRARCKFMEILALAQAYGIGWIAEDAREELALLE